jgi:hypothetical protein
VPLRIIVRRQAGFKWCLWQMALPDACQKLGKV